MNLMNAVSAQNGKSRMKEVYALNAEISAAEAEAARINLSAVIVPLSMKKTATMTFKKSKRKEEAPKSSPKV